MVNYRKVRLAMNNSLSKNNSLNNFKTIDNTQLSEIDGGIAPLLIAGGIIVAGGGGFAAGYGLSRWLG